MSRVQRKYSPTGCYHIMLRGNERKKIFLEHNDRQRFLDTLLKKKNETELLVYGYCLMDNHVHLILRDDQNEISTIMKGIATSYAMFFNSKYNRIGHVFQDRFKSEAVNDDRQLMAVIRYVHNNPVKARIVERPDHYEWSSYGDYVSPGVNGLVDAYHVLEMISGQIEAAINEFKQFSNGRDEAEFMDDDDRTIKTLEEGSIFLDEILAKKWSGLPKEAILKDKTSRDQVVKELRDNTGLSIRRIAELLGLHRRIIERIVSK